MAACTRPQRGRFRERSSLDDALGVGAVGAGQHAGSGFAHCEFLIDYEVDEEESSRKKKPWLYRWPDEAIARLLELNARRAAQEALAGASGAKARKAARGSRRQVPTRRGCSGEELSPPPSPSRAGVQMIHSR